MVGLGGIFSPFVSNHTRRGTEMNETDQRVDCHISELTAMTNFDCRFEEILRTSRQAR